MTLCIRYTALALVLATVSGFISIAQSPARRLSTNTESAAARVADEALPSSSRCALGRRSMLSSSAMALLTSFGAVVTGNSEPSLAAESLASAKGCYADCTAECNKLAKGAEEYCADTCKSYCETEGAPSGNAEVASTGAITGAAPTPSVPAKSAEGPKRDANTLSSKTGDFFGGLGGSRIPWKCLHFRWRAHSPAPTTAMAPSSCPYGYLGQPNEVSDCGISFQHQED